MERKKRNLNNILDALVDKDGLKTEVTITLTNETLIKIIGAFLLSGITVMVVANLIKNHFPNAQLTTIQKQLENFKQP